MAASTESLAVATSRLLDVARASVRLAHVARPDLPFEFTGLTFFVYHEVYMGDFFGTPVDRTLYNIALEAYQDALRPR